MRVRDVTNERDRLVEELLRCRRSPGEGKVWDVWEGVGNVRGCAQQNRLGRGLTSSISAW